MIYSATDSTSITLPLTLKMHQIAERFYKFHTPGEKARQVYLNTLSVLAVQSYLDMMGIKTELAAAESWQVPMQALSEVADLPISNRGTLECRPVLPTETTCYVPPESWEERLGFVAVQFDQDLREATLLGFLPKVQTEYVSLENWQPLEQLLDHLNPQPIRLLQWLDERFEEGWESLEQLVRPNVPGWQFRRTRLTPPVTTLPSPMTCRGKQLILENLDNPISLVVGLQKNDKGDFEVWAKVFPLGDLENLPTGLELQVLDQDEIAVMQAQARETASIQVNFLAQKGETFGIRLMLDDESWVETFVL